MTGPSGTPSDWVSGERVFAPPTGTLDVDWLVPAVLEAVPGTSPAQARAALVEAWQDRTTSGDRPGAPADAGTTLAEEDQLGRAAERVVTEALRSFRV